MPEDVYTIDLPGFTDFIRIPALEDYQLKKERIQRMRTHVSPVPEEFQWIPSVINQLDNAQDLLFTGLVLAKPLLREIPERFIPGVGWVLIANDLLNLGTGILGGIVSGKGPKKAVLRGMKDLSFNRVQRAAKVGGFLNRSQWFGFAIQAPQALQSVTGYGLVLGGLMGAISEVPWAAVSSLLGNQVEFRGPPTDDVLNKSIDFLVDAPYQLFGGQILSADDHFLLLAAGSLASQFVAELGTPGHIEGRFDRLAATQVPIRRPWEKSSIAALAAAGIAPDGPQRPFIPTPSPKPTFLETARVAAGSAVRFQSDMRDVFGPTSRGTLASMLYHQTGKTLWEFVHDDPAAIVTEYGRFDIFLMSVVEFNVFPIRPLTPDDLLRWFRATSTIVDMRGLRSPGRRELQDGALDALGAWTERPVGFN